MSCINGQPKKHRVEKHVFGMSAATASLEIMVVTSSMTSRNISENDVIKWGHLSSDRGACATCGSVGDIEKHHVSYSPEKHISVCRKCHWRIHHEPGYRDELNPFHGRKPSIDLFDTGDEKRVAKVSKATKPYAEGLNENPWPAKASDTCEPGKHDMIWSACARRICAFCGRTREALIEADFYYERGDSGEQSRLP